jgi:hypothetical protein
MRARAFIVVYVEARDVIISGFTVTNGSNGIEMEHSHSTVLSNLIIQNITWTGITTVESDFISVLNCNIFNNYDGLSISDSCSAEIIDCELYNHSSQAIGCWNSRNLRIVNVTSHHNQRGMVLWYADY